QILYTSNLTLFASQALTNDAATLQGLYPGLVVLSSSNYFVNINITNVTPYFTNYPWDPFGAAAHLVFATNLTPVVQTRYKHTFDNALTTVHSSSGWSFKPLTTVPPATNRAFITIETDTIGTGADPFAPVGTIIIRTNST